MLLRTSMRHDHRLSPCLSCILVTKYPGFKLWCHVEPWSVHQLQYAKVTTGKKRDFSNLGGRHRNLK